MFLLLLVEIDINEILFKFLNESATQQAQRLGLEGDGHGGWYDRMTGEFVAKTEKED